MLPRALWIFLPLALVCGCATQSAPDDAGLGKIHAVLEPMRGAVPNDKRGATPALTDAKHELRGWIESRLPALAADGDEHVFAAQLNQELQQADLFCATVSDPKQDRCDHSPDADWNATGYIKAVRLERRQGVLFVVTRVGIDCGEDDSAYAYEWRHNRWQRIWAYEQPIDSGLTYQPQYIRGIRASLPDRRTHARLLLLLGQDTWCSSNWHPVYYRLWRLRPGDAGAKLLVDGAEPAFFANDPPIEGSVSNQDATVEFRAGSLDSDFHSYETIRRYEIAGDGVTRVEPIALGPRGFVEEWLRGSWAEASVWSEPASRAALQASHVQLHPLYANLGEYIGEHTQRCRKSSDLWQVGIGFGSAEKPKRKAFFLVRWRPPYRFQMAAISASPRIDCDVPDQSADAERTLFQDWH